MKSFKVWTIKIDFLKLQIPFLKVEELSPKLDE